VEVLSDIDALPGRQRLVVVVGVFDGLHRGHGQILRTTARTARQLAARSVVVTFDPHPDAVLRGAAPALLCDPGERMARLAEAGIDIAVAQRFDRSFAAQTADAFLARLGRGRVLAGVVMSPESAFGRDRAGTLDTVRGVSARLGFRVVEVAPMALGGERVSSSRIRELLGMGRLAAVRRLLGRRYAVIGRVVHGERRGRRLGFPTANLAFAQPVALPPNGIYAVRVSWDGPHPLQPLRRAPGVASLGVRPTFGGGERLLEVYLLDFDEDLYERDLRVEFVRRQRGERRYGSIDRLIEQMGRDVERTREILDTVG
jgi:riboflavin kinase / FMN adenylyltransferase